MLVVVPVQDIAESDLDQVAVVEVQAEEELRHD